MLDSPSSEAAALLPSMRVGTGAARIAVMLTLVSGAWMPAALAQTGEGACGNPATSWYGPFDYRTAPKGALMNVETHHFTAQVEQLIRGVTTDAKTMGKDVGYVLGVFPNHHRALLTMMRMSERDNNDQPRGTGRPMECWFDRAVRYAPDDTVARLMYAMWLRKKGRAEDSLAQTRTAENSAKDNPLTHFNVGMSYFELGKFEQAVAAALRARELGLSKPDLINRLKSANQWPEPQQ